MKILAAAFALAALPALAQSPYAGLETRPVKALSEQQVGDLQSGRGMGLALAAELNGYPGPSHVLELADKLGLSAEQRSRVQGMFDAMKREAVPLGLRLIAQETDLDRQFAARAITPASLKTAVAEIATTQGELRETHLKYHLTTLDVLTDSQRQRYSELRGYTSGATQHRHHRQ